MTVEKKEGIAWAFGGISDMLGGVMDQIKWLTTGFSDYIKEFISTMTKTKLDLSALKTSIEWEKKEETTKELLKKSKEFGPKIERLSSNFSPERTKSELNRIYSLFLEKHEDGGVWEKELEFILGLVTEDKKYVNNNKNKGIKEIIKKIDNKLTIRDVVIAHKSLKLNNPDIEITEQQIIEKINKNNQPEQKVEPEAEAENSQTETLI